MFFSINNIIYLKLAMKWVPLSNQSPLTLSGLEGPGKGREGYICPTIVMSFRES